MSNWNNKRTPGESPYLIHGQSCNKDEWIIHTPAGHCSSGTSWSPLPHLCSLGVQFSQISSLPLWPSLGQAGQGLPWLPWQLVGPWGLISEFKGSLPLFLKDTQEQFESLSTVFHRNHARKSYFPSPAVSMLSLAKGCHSIFWSTPTMTLRPDSTNGFEKTLILEIKVTKKPSAQTHRCSKVNWIP